MSRFVNRTEPLQIDAPVDLVWDILTDLDAYGEWNPLTPEIRTDFTVGSPIDLQVVTGGKPMEVSATVRAFDPPRLISWGGSFGARWLSGFVREQHLEPLGENSCRYHNVERLSGLLAPMMLLFLGRLTRRNFTSVATELKQRAESKHNETE